jgi:hypothetical protein
VIEKYPENQKNITTFYYSRCTISSSTYLNILLLTNPP